jgi:hypothetical protein
VLRGGAAKALNESRKCFPETLLSSTNVVPLAQLMLFSIAMAYSVPITELQPLLSGDSPSCNESNYHFLRSSSPALSDDGLANYNTTSRKAEQDPEGGNNERAYPSTYSLVPLFRREAHDSEYKDDETGFFPWKIYKSSPMIVDGGIKYYKRKLLIPDTEIRNVETDLYDDLEPSGDDGIDYWGEGLYSDNEGKWYEIDQDEVYSPTVTEEDEVWDGDDGEKYRKSIGCLRGLFVRLRREVVITNNVRHIAHLAFGSD